MRARRLTGALVLATAGLGFFPLPVTAAPSTVAPTVEGWYQPNPTCALPVGCVAPDALPVPAPVPVSPYRARTLHVGVAGGQETARAYLGLDGAALRGATGALLTVPLDVSPTSGTTSPETAKLQVCLATGAIAAVEGSLAEPPAVDCTNTALVSYVATPQPHLEADLGPLLGGTATATGLALLPDGTGITPTDAWRTVFSSRGRTGEGVPAPASLAVERNAAAPVATGTEGPAPAAVDLPGLTASAPDASFDLPGGAAPLVPVDAPVADVPLTAPAPMTAVPVQDVALPETVRVGYAYPAVWLLPLALLVLLPAVARTLTRDLTPRAPSRHDTAPYVAA